MASIEPNKKRINWVKIVFWEIVISIGILWYLGVLNILIDYLSSKELTFKVGKLSFTPFTVLKSFVILIGMLWLAGRLSTLIERPLRKSHRIRANDRALIMKMTNIILYLVALLITLSILGIDLTSLTIFSGAIGIGVGFGLQKIASNFISGLILLFERTINEGDLVELPGGTPTSVIRRIGGRFTLLEAADGREIMVPNEDFITNRVTNYTYSDKFGRVDINISIAYDSDPAKAKELIANAARNHKLCSKRRPPECYLLNLGQATMDFRLLFWLDDITTGKFEATNDVLFEIWAKFREHGIIFPRAQMDINIIKNEEDKNDAKV